MIEMPAVYRVRITVSTTPEAPGTQRVFRMNSIFDPDYTNVDITPHKPRFYNEASLQYNVYTVISSSVTAKITALWTSGNVSSSPLLFTLRMTRVGESVSDPPLQVALEQRTGMAKRQITTAFGRSSVGTASLSGSYNRAQHFKTNPDGKNSQRAIFGANPSSNVFAVLNLYNTSTVATAYSTVCDIQVRMVYRVLLSDRKVINSSG